MTPVLSHHERGGLSYLRGGDGDPLLLLHGLPGSSHSWEPAGCHLASHYDVIIPDLSGFGHSEGLDRELHLDHAFYMEAHAETIHGLLDALDLDAFYLAGHDFGGAVAVTLLRLFPEYTPKGLVLMATNLFTDTPVPLPLRLAGVPGLGTAVVRLVAGTRLGLRAMYWAAVHDKDTFGVEDFERHLTPSGIDQTRRIFRRSLTDMQGNYEDVEALLPQLDVPTLVLWGDRDPFFSVEEAERLVDTLPDATLTIFKETGHFVPEERPEGVAWHVRDFLRARSSRPPRPIWERWSSS
jgi:pimeloyl-ACP methyl ester carboxylesterase